MCNHVVGLMHYIHSTNDLKGLIIISHRKKYEHEFSSVSI